MSWIPVVLLAVLAGLPLVRYALFLGSNRRAGRLGTIRDRCGGLLFPLFFGAASALWSEVLTILFYPLGWLAPALPGGRGLHVVLVHGLCHNGSAWTLFRPGLVRAGFGNVHVHAYDSCTRDFTAAVAGLRDILHGIYGPRPDARVVLVGHSLGGLVCRRIAGHEDFRERLAGLVTLGTPHQGSVLARLGWGAVAPHLIPGGAVPREVERVPDPVCPRLALLSPVDDFVFPLHCLDPGRDGWKLEFTPPMSHVAMLYSPWVRRRVIRFLESVVS